MSKMNLQIFALLSLFLATELTASTGGLKVITEKSGLISIIDLVKVHEKNSSFFLPRPPDKGFSENGDKTKCQENELIYESDDKCYPKRDELFRVGVASPCNHHLQKYSERVYKPGYGECTCKRYKPPSTHPVVHWKENNQCYLLYDQGPCTKGQWLVFNNDTSADGSKTVICIERTCPENTEEDRKALFPKLVFVHNGKCLKTETKNPEFCGNEKDRIYFAMEKPEPVCLDMRPIPRAKDVATLSGFPGL